MTLRTGMILGWLAALGAAGCEVEKASPPGAKTPPAEVAHPAHEEELATIKLTEKAEKRLGIFIVEAQRKAVPRQRTLGGEVISRPGQTVSVSAPVSGKLAAAANGGAPPPGAMVQRGEAIFTLLPLMSTERSLLTPAERIQMADAQAGLDTLRTEAKQQVALAEIQVEAAKKTLARAEQLLRDRAGSQQAVEDAQAAYDLAQKTVETAGERLTHLEKTKLDAETGGLATLAITTPVTGVLSNFGAVPGEVVVTGATLFEVISYDRVWIRVPVYAGQWSEVDTERVARVTELGQGHDAAGREAKPVAAPPSANPDAATIDLFYELDNADAYLRPGQKVAVTLPLKGERESLVVPWAAVLYDIHGGTWVYEQIEPQTFIRRRVHVRFVSGSDAVLADGPEPGAQIVTDGAAELFGTEFGFGK
jgi:cobalt-zinc-cadmium efflux system membrane fusion protein